MRRVLGKVNKDVAEKWYLDKYINKKIVFYDDRLEHCKEHINNYEKEEDFYYVYDNLEQIITNPDYVYYDTAKRGLEYYKKLKSNILVAVRIKDANELKVKSFYPVTDTKIENRQKKEVKAMNDALIEKYKYKEPV